MASQRVKVGGGIALSLVIVTGVALLTQRDVDTAVVHSVTDDGDELYHFTGHLTPELPDEPETAGDFEELVGLLALDQVVADAAVAASDSTVASWRDNRGWEIRVTGKTCDDGIACVDRVLVHPDGETRLRNLDAAFDAARLVTPVDYEIWPFTVERALLRCSPPKAVTLTTVDQVYALNAPARTPDRRDIGEILQDHPLRAGEKLSFGPVFFDAIALCGEARPIAAGG